MNSTSPVSPPPPPPPSSPPPPAAPSASPPPPAAPSASPPPPSPPPPSTSNNGNSGTNSNSTTNNDGGNNGTFSPPPPPPSSKSGDSSSPPPPKSSSKGSSSSHHSSSSKSDNDSSSDSDGGNGTNSGTDNVVPIVVGVVVGVGLLFLLALLAYTCTCRKKKKRLPQHDYYGHEVDGDYYGPGNSQPHYNNNWQNGSQDHYQVNLPPPPGGIAGGPGGWLSPTPPPQGTRTMMSSGETSSSNFSGPHGPALPPPHPSVALGFTKSSFTYEELAHATNGFSQANLLGQGGFGYVHKGILPNGKEVAVKSLKAGSGQGDREFQAEVEIISRVHHRHLVSLVGYSIAGGQKLLVYEFVPNSTLEHHLHGKGQPVMDWSSRMKIALGSAKGLAYLHEDCHPKIIHRDIKAANILLDYNFEAKVADFGLAKLSSDTNTHVSTRVMGTFGYLAPEYAASGKLTDKSDVFSFGVMLLELITGRRPIDVNSDMDDSLVDWARPLCDRVLEDGDCSKLADPLLEGNYDPQEMVRMVACAGSSVRHSARRRPKMSQIVRALEGDISVDNMRDGVTSNNPSAVFSGSDYDSNSYSNDMRKFRKTAFESTEYASSEYGQTSEYGLNPSSSSSSEASSRVGSRQL